MDRTRCIPIHFRFLIMEKEMITRPGITIIIIMITGMREMIMLRMAMHPETVISSLDRSAKIYYQMGENTVKALEKMGVLSDTWHLYNYDELDEIQKKTGVTE